MEDPMRSGMTIATIAALLVVAAAPAQAKTVLYTPFVDVGATHLGCSVVNVSKKELSVAIDWIDFTGTVKSTDTVDVMPGHAAFSTFSGTQVLFCRFTFDGGKNSVRAAYCVGSPCQATGEAR